MFDLFRTAPAADFGANPLAGTSLDNVRDAVAYAVAHPALVADPFLAAMVGRALVTARSFRDQCLYVAFAAPVSARDAAVVLVRLAASLRGQERAEVLGVAADLFYSDAPESAVLSLLALHHAILEVPEFATSTGGWLVADALDREVPSAHFRVKLLQSLYENPDVVAISEHSVATLR